MILGLLGQGISQSLASFIFKGSAFVVRLSLLGYAQNLILVEVEDDAFSV